MKKLISLILAVAMLVSLVAVNVSAAVPTGVPSGFASLFSQDYQDTANNAGMADTYGDGAYSRGYISIEAETEGSDNMVAHLTPNTSIDAQGISIPNTAITDIDKDVFSIRFDVFPVGAVVYGGIEIYLNTPNHRTLGGLANGLQVHLAPNTMTAGVWNNIKIDFDFTSLRAGGTMGTEAGCTNIQVYTKKATDAAYAQKSCVNNWGNGIRIRTDSWMLGTQFRTANDVFVIASRCLQTSGDYANVNFLLDNIDICYPTEEVVYPSTGVYASQDYEYESNTLWLTALNGQGSVTKVREANGNHAVLLDGNDAGSYGDNGYGNCMLLLANNIEGVDGTDWTVSFDVNCVKKGSAVYLEMYPTGTKTAGGGTGVAIWTTGMNLNTWYRYKVGFWGENQFGVFRKDLSAPNAQWVAVGYKANNLYDGTSVATPQFRTGGTLSSTWGCLRLGMIGKLGADEVAADATVDVKNTQMMFDNITLATSATSASLSAATKTASAINATFNVDALSKANTTGTMSVVMATYDNWGILQDVDVKTPTMVAGEVSGVNLSTDVVENGTTVIYVWESLTNGVPVLKDAFDITSYID